MLNFILISDQKKHFIMHRKKIIQKISTKSKILRKKGFLGMTFSGALFLKYSFRSEISKKLYFSTPIVSQVEKKICPLRGTLLYFLTLNYKIHIRKADIRAKRINNLS
jgi:hypothetical protein